MKWNSIAAILVAMILLATAAAVIPIRTDHSLSAKVGMVGDLPVIEVRGDDRSDGLIDADVDTVESYHKWIMDNITDGKKLPLMAVDGCSAFSITTENDRFVGRNLEFTYFSHTPVLVKNTPYDGYRSIGMMPWIAVFDATETVEDANNDIRARAAPMLTMDGMNEKGLMCALLVTIGQQVSQDREDTWCTFALMRYLLDHVATVDETIEVLGKKGYCNGFTVGDMIRMTLHVFVADAEGNTLVIECIDGELCLTIGKDANVVTNHCLSDKSKVTPKENSLWRYNILKAEVTKIEGNPEKECTLERCRDMLESVSRKWDPEGPTVQSFTRWSEVYDVKDLTVYIWLYCQYDSAPYAFSMRDMYRWQTI